jgi:hypothetical protein
MLKRVSLSSRQPWGWGLGRHSLTPETKTNARAPLLSGLGHMHHAVTTSKPEAKRYFDQGLT